MFYHSSYARSSNLHGLLAYGSAAKTIIDLIDEALRRILRSFFSRNSESLSIVLTKYKILTASELDTSDS